MTTMVREHVYVKVPRAELVAALLARDGMVCQYPECGGVLDMNAPAEINGKSNPLEVTIDHWKPQWWGKENGWTLAQIWHLDNLKLMHKKCNAKKGDRIPDENGVLPPRVERTWKNRRAKRATRPELCYACDNGNNLFRNEICASCGCDAKRFPTAAKVRYPDCDHAKLWCWVCSITPEMRPSAVDLAVLHAESGEW